jgi:hypothetical protein
MNKSRFTDTSKIEFTTDTKKIYDLVKEEQNTILQWLENYLLSIEKDNAFTLKEVISAINFARSLNFVKMTDDGNEIFFEFRKYDNNSGEIT